MGSNFLAAARLRRRIAILAFPMILPISLVGNEVHVKSHAMRRCISEKARNWRKSCKRGAKRRILTYCCA